MAATFSTETTAKSIMTSDSLLSPVAGFMDYDPKYAASVSHRVNKRASDMHKVTSWFKF